MTDSRTNPRQFPDWLGKRLCFLIGWMLSPLNWWNDAFINIPLSYLIANILFYLVHIKFSLLIIVSYWFTNILGLAIVWFNGRDIVISSRNKLRTAALLVITLIGYTAAIMFLDRWGKLLPLGEFLRRFIR